MSWYPVIDLVVPASYTVAVMMSTEAAAHYLTWGVLTSSAAGILNDGITEQLATWTWFRWAKRISLLFVLMLNVGEAAVLMLQNGNFAGGVPCLVLALVAPDFDRVDEQGRVVCADEVSFLGCALPFRFSSLWYFRAYYVILSLPFSLTAEYVNSWFFICVSCLWPLFCQEVLFPRTNVAVIFKIRAFMLISEATLMDSFIHRGTIILGTPFALPVLEGLRLNLVSAGIIVVMFVVVLLRDRDDLYTGLAATGPMPKTLEHIRRTPMMPGNSPISCMRPGSHNGHSMLGVHGCPNV